MELVNILLGCGEEVRAAIGRRIRNQCEQNWGALCASLSFCSLEHAEHQGMATLTPTPAFTAPLGGSASTLPPGSQSLFEAEQVQTLGERKHQAQDNATHSETTELRKSLNTTKSR